MFGIVDYDPDGLNILLHYRRGPRVTGHDECLTLPDIKWLGIRSEHLGRDCRLNEQTPVHGSAKSVLFLSARDRTLASRMLERSDDSNNVDVRCELQRMLMLGYKAEIQAADDNGNLSRWAETHLMQHILNFGGQA